MGIVTPSGSTTSRYNKRAGRGQISQEQQRATREPPVSLSFTAWQCSLDCPIWLVLNKSTNYPQHRTDWGPMANRWRGRRWVRTGGRYPKTGDREACSVPALLLGHKHARVASYSHLSASSAQMIPLAARPLTDKRNGPSISQAIVTALQAVESGKRRREDAKVLLKPSGTQRLCLPLEAVRGARFD